MSWNIQQQEDAFIVTLEPHMRIQIAVEFHRALLPIAGSGKMVRIDASTNQTIHTTILQILYSLSLSASAFEISNPSPAFLSSTLRAGLLFRKKTGSGHVSQREFNATLAP